MSQTSTSPSRRKEGPPEIHHTHRDVTGGWLRPAVFGAMDGVVTNVALITGVAAADASAHIVALTGLAGLLAGAFSMSVGEWTSVRSQQELVHAEIATERGELSRRPVAEQAELAAMFMHKGLPRELAATVASELSKDPDVAWRVHVREELGVDPDDLPSANTAAVSSLFSFSIGAAIPLLPYLFGARSVWLSLVLAGLALVLLGVTVARITHRPAWIIAARHVALAAAAVAITFGVGHAFGVGVS